METELAWRQEELAFFKNQLCNIQDENQRNKYRKSLVLMLYSHFEGFVKICLLSYIQYVNSLKLKREEFNERLIASSMNSEFNAYDIMMKSVISLRKSYQKIGDYINFIEELISWKK